MKSKVLFLLVLLSIIFVIVFIQEDGINIKIKQITTLQKGIIIETTVPLNVSEISKIPLKIGANKIKENSNFLIPIVIENKGNTDYINTKIKFDYEGRYIQKMVLYSKSKQPLKLIEDNIYEFDKTLIATQTTQLLIAGSVGSLPEGLEEGKVKFTLTLLNETNQKISEKIDYIIITKNQV